MLGRRGSDHVLIRVVDRMYPGAGDFWDGNWLTSPIAARIAGFTADLDAALRADELCSFRKELQNLHRKLRGSARLVTLEEWIKVEVRCERNGHLEVEGELSTSSPAHNRLRFSLPGLDQTDLVPLIDALLAIERRFPVRGRS
ncbi:WapI family immunity protein [Parafrankia irregularis]|uniref:WapI family immunity protein n=1 Tax=Parafrankia irregularis TaxID=795642 RepID=UPI000B827275|nr:hypothetical protein [Parafrankia irregularis]MBE3203600.1 hypothetical protein [Parafrankia sp. CH37]